MNRIFLCVLITLVFTCGAFAQDDGKMISFDVGGGLAVPFFTDESLEEMWGTSADEVGILTTILLTKISLFVDGRFLITPSISVGVELGAYLLMFSDPSVYEFPLRALFRYGGKGTFVEVLAGYYVSDPLLSGVEIGARAALGGLYVDFTYVLAEYGYYNVGIGYIVTNIFGF